MNNPEVTKTVEEKAKALAQLWNSQPVVYTDENVFDVEEDDEDDGI